MVGNGILEVSRPNKMDELTSLRATKLNPHISEDTLGVGVVESINCIQPLHVHLGVTMKRLPANQPVEKTQGTPPYRNNW